MKTVFLAWQDSVARGWHPIGRLTRIDGGYEFAYIHGAQKAAEKHGFHALQSFPRLDAAYRSEELFPLFANRLLRPSRPDYPQFIEWLGLTPDVTDPIEILARSGGRRVTDDLEVFPCPEPDENGEYHTHFLVHGLRHLPEPALERINSLAAGERLFLMHDFQNRMDPNALALKTDSFDGDSHIVGYCPRYFAEDFRKISQLAETFAAVTVARVNRAPAPLQMRLLCELRAKWPTGFKPLCGDDFKPVPPGASAVEKAA